MFQTVAPAATLPKVLLIMVPSGSFSTFFDWSNVGFMGTYRHLIPKVLECPKENGSKNTIGFSTRSAMQSALNLSADLPQTDMLTTDTLTFPKPLASSLKYFKGDPSMYFVSVPFGPGPLAETIYGPCFKRTSRKRSEATAGHVSGICS